MNTLRLARACSWPMNSPRLWGRSDGSASSALRLPPVTSRLSSAMVCSHASVRGGSQGGLDAAVGMATDHVHRIGGYRTGRDRSIECVIGRNSPARRPALLHRHGPQSAMTATAGTLASFGDSPLERFD